MTKHMLIIIVAQNTTEINNDLALGEDQDTIERPLRGRQRMNVTQKLALVSASTLERDFNEVLQDEPSKILQREYLLASYNVVVGSLIFDPMFNLMTLPVLTQYMAGFSYFRSGIKLRFVMVSNPANFGVVAVSWAPEVSSGDVEFDWTNKDPTLLDISQQEGCEITIPYTSILECQTLPYTNLHWQIRLHIRTLGSETIDPNSPAPILLVYGSLYEPKFFGALSQMYKTKERLQMPIVEDLVELTNEDKQMVPYVADEYNPRKETSSALTVFSGAMDIASTVGVIAAPELAPVIGAASIALDLVSWGYDFITEMWDRYTGVEEDKVDYAHEESEPIKYSTYGNVAGCIYGPTLNMNSHLDNKRAPYNLTDLNFKHKVLDICKIPTLRNLFTLTAATALALPGTAREIVFEPLRSFAERPSYMDHWANTFRFWRGSIKVCLKFFCSPLSSGTVLVYTINQRGLPITGDATEYAFKRIVNVRGSTTVSFVVPFVHTQSWFPIKSNSLTVNTNYLTRLFVRMEAGPSLSGATPGNIMVLPIISAGDDFQFKSLCSPIPIDVVSQINVNQEWKNLQFDNVCEGGEVKLLENLYEDGLTAEEMSMRYSNRPPAHTVKGGLTMSYALVSDPRNLELFDFVQNSFRYVRGGFRMKTPAIPVSGAECLAEYNNFLTRHYPPVTTLDGYLLGNGVCANSSESAGGNALFEIEVPYNQTTDWICTQIALPPSTQLVSQPRLAISVSSLSVQFVSAGRDYQLAHLLPPKALSLIHI